MKRIYRKIWNVENAVFGNLFALSKIPLYTLKDCDMLISDFQRQTAEIDIFWNKNSIALNT